MVREILDETRQKMGKTVELFRREVATTRAGRASPSLLDKVVVDYYGVPTPVNQMATIQAPEPRLLVIQPWDRTQLGAIERAILRSELGITPVSDGTVIRLVIPQLTEERRLELVRQLRRKAEEERVAIRNLRREANDWLKELEREGELSEDDCRRAMDEVQKLTDRHVADIDAILAAKEQEIMEV